MRKNSFYFFIGLLSSLSVKSQQVKIGQRFTDTTILYHQKPQLIQTASAQLDRGYPYTVEGIEYLIVIDKDSLIKYIRCDAKRFKTMSRYQIGMSCNQVAKMDIESKSLDYGMGEVIKLKSGWSFLIPKNATDCAINYFFKR